MFHDCEWLLISMRSVFWRSLVALAALTILCSFSIVNVKVTGAEEMSLETNTSASCEPGWMLQGESCFRHTTWALPWSAAQGICRSMNSLLAEVENAREQDALHDFLKGLPYVGVWIGLSYRGDTSNWTWGSGRSMNYSNWELGEPDNFGGNEYCVNVWPLLFSKWNDANCTKVFYGVCQRAAAAYSTSPALDADVNVSHSSAQCESGWMLKGESCYTLTAEELMWNEAQESCRSMNGILAEAQNDRELRALNDFIDLTASSINELWIGLKDQQNDRNWTWGSGRPMNYSNWFPTEPNNIGELCVSVWPWAGSSWNDNNCTKSLPGVCQKEYCGGGWTSTKKSCYLLTNATTRAAAQAQCNSLNGSLVEINNSYEQEELHDFLKSQDASVAWIGLSDAGKNRKWKWDSGSNLTYQYWNPGEPNNAKGEEYCVSVWKPNNYEWKDSACDSKYAAVCKQNKDTFNCCHQESPSSEYSTPHVHLTGGTLAAVVCSAVGALIIVAISIYLWIRKPWKKHPAGHDCGVRLSTTTLPNENKCVPQQDYYIECSNSSHYASPGLGEWPPTSFPIDEEEYYEEIIDHTQSTYCHLDAQPRSPPNVYDTPL